MKTYRIIIKEHEAVFGNVSKVLEKFNKKNIDFSQRVILNIEKIIYLHSSFLGFLINIKNEVNRCGGQLELISNCVIDKQLSNADLLHYFKNSQETIK
jgi:hypothetical protein